LASAPTAGNGARVAALAKIRQLIDSGRFKEAKTSLVHAEQRYPGDREASFCWVRHDLACDLLEDAGARLESILARNPDDMDGLLLLVELSLKKNDIAAAAAAVSRAMEQAPDNAEVLRHAGKIHRQAGNDEDALVCFETALTHAPQSIAVLADLSNYYIEQSQWGMARGHLDSMCRIAPKNASAFLGFGTACLRMGDYQEARRALQQALRLDPGSVAAMINLGAVYRLTKELDNALRILTQAMQKDPENAEALAALSSLHVDMKQFAQGLDLAARAVQHAPNNPESYATCAYAQIKLGHYAEAEHMYRTALALNPRHAQAGFGLGSILLMQGQLEQGWHYYRARFDVQQKWLDGPWPIWHGETLVGKTLLVRTEQGLGDTIQFARFLPLVQRLLPKTIFMTCTPALRRLFRCFDDYVVFLPLELKVDEIQADYQTALMEMPSMLGVNTVDDIPADCPYLFAEQQEVEVWRSRLEAYAAGRFKIGLVWAGNPNHTDDHNRSLALSELAPLFDLPDACYFSLQLGAKVDQLQGFRQQVTDLAGELGNFSDTAAFMANMDFIVSVDTAPVHLAGALNRPGAVLLPFMPDWRWLLERGDSPWYPSLQLFRQPSPGDWQSVVRELKEFLEKKIR